MRGHLQQRGKDSWRCKVFLGRSPDGQRRYLERTIRGSRSDAEQQLARLVVEAGEGRWVPTEPMTMGELVDRWLRLKETTVEPGTVANYWWICRQYVLPAFGHRKVASIRTMEPGEGRHSPVGRPPRDLPALGLRGPGLDPARARRRVPRLRDLPLAPRRHRVPARRGLRAPVAGRLVGQQRPAHPPLDRPRRLGDRREGHQDAPVRPPRQGHDAEHLQPHPAGHTDAKTAETMGRLLDPLSVTIRSRRIRR